MRALIAGVALSLAASVAAAQAPAMPGMTTPAAPAAAKPAPAAPSGDHGSMADMDMAGMDMGGVAGMDMGGVAGMAMSGTLGSYPMNREASGTSWQPEVASPGAGMGDMLMKQAGGWMLMGHVQLDAVYDDQGGKRGDEKGFLAGMIMGMAGHPLAGGVLSFRGMVSPDPFMGKSGYPLLLATGETADGKTPLIDRQHPHDLIDEIAVAYSHPLSQDVSGFLYVAPVGEPALGPPAFMHRTSGMDSPEAPISHHWLDSTHITYGVVTAGLVKGPWKLEVSGFRGREPDQERFDIETPKLDSVAVRATWNPSPRWSLQASWGRLKSPEQLTPTVDEDRVTASIAYAQPVFATGVWSSTLAFGRKMLSPGQNLDAVLAESELVLNRRWTLFTRAEWKEDDELDPSAIVYRVAKATVGVIRDFPLGAKTVVGLGALGSVYDIPGGLKSLYGSAPVSGMLFLRFRAG